MSARKSLAIAFILGGIVATAFAQDDDPSKDHVTLTPNGNSVTLDIYSGRPVSSAVDALVQRYGYVITYEDPQFLYSDDTTDATVYVRKDHRAAGPGIPKLLLPRGSELSMELPGSTCISPDAMASIVQQLVALRTSRGSSFRVEQSEAGSIFHVIPTEARDAHGDWTAQVSPLDARISFPAAPRTEGQLLGIIVRAVSVAARVKMSFVIDGGVAIGIPSRRPFQFNVGADDETAREVLTRMLQARSERKQTWSLLNGVEEGQNVYMLNVTDLPANAGCLASPPPPPHPAPRKPACISCAGPPAPG